MNDDSNHIKMNLSSTLNVVRPEHVEANTAILVVPYMWIGDFVRSHSVVKVLRARWPSRPIDVLTSSLCAPLVDYMPGLRKGIVCDLPRGRLPVGRYLALGRQLRTEGYGTALIMLRTWKAALAPFLAGIPERIGFVGEMRFGLINDLRFGERALPRMIDRCAVLALPSFRRNGRYRSSWFRSRKRQPGGGRMRWSATTRRSLLRREPSVPRNAG